MTTRIKPKGPTASTEIHDYVVSTALRLPQGMEQLLEATEKMPMSGMATTPLQGQFLAFLMRSMNAINAIEVGVFTGQGTLWMADAVGPAGKVIACDVSEEFTAVAKSGWAAGGVTDRIDLCIAPALETLSQLIADGHMEKFDFCYVDADKEMYDTYYDLVLKLLRPGGVIAFDNMLQHGKVADPSAADARTTSIRKLNKRLHEDERVDVSFLPVFDGLYLVRKR